MTRRAYFTLVALLVSSVFLWYLDTLVSSIVAQSRAELAAKNLAQAFASAEAGLEYYRWHLAHFPNDFSDGSGAPGPFTHAITDGSGAPAGSFSLSLAGNSYCGSTNSNSVLITSTGMSALGSAYTRAISARYAPPPVSAYAYIVNSDEWVRGSETVNGPFLSNGGVRMDGTPNSLVSSAQSTWTCAANSGCSPSKTEPGVFGSGGAVSLRAYPVPPVSFGAIASGLAALKIEASSTGIYLPPSGAYGYQVVFNPDGSVTAYPVASVRQVWGYTSQSGWRQENSVIASLGTGVTYALPASCPLVFVEDNVWTEGVVSGRAALVAANLTGSGPDANVILSNNLTNENANGDGATIIGQGNVLLSLLSPDIMRIRGVFVAVNGMFGRNEYLSSGTHAVPPDLSSGVLRSSLSVFGTVVSNARSVAAWYDENGSLNSGYGAEQYSVDRALAKNPPPFTPAAGAAPAFVDWEEQD